MGVMVERAGQRAFGPQVGLEESAAALGTAARFLLFAAILLYFWVGYEGFQDPTDPAMLRAKEGGNVLNQTTTIALVIASAIFVWLRATDQISAVVTPVLVLLVLWIGVSIVFSSQPGLSGKRFVLATFLLFLSAVFVLLPRTERQFTAWLGAILLAVIALCFASVLLVPDLAIHQVYDLREPDLAGAWRGAFPHKNAAGSAMLLAVFAGVYIARTHHLALGLAVAALAAVFLVFTKSKTPLLILPATLLLTWLVLRLRSTLARFLVILAFVAAFNLMTVGSVVFPWVRAIVEAIMPDPSFTDRTSIWAFATGEVLQRPITGYGFHAYWSTDALLTSGSGIETWATKASHAHNSYLDLMLNIGLPGLVLTVLWLAWRPARDLTHAEQRGASRALSQFYTLILTFSLLSASLESHIFAGGGPMWFMTLVALFGLRYQATADLVRDDEAAAPAGGLRR